MPSKSLKSQAKNENVHEGPKEFNCQVCKLDFPQFSDLQTHIETVHEDQKQIKSIQQEKLKEYHCTLCKKRLSSLKSLKRHVKTIHEGRKDHKCKICNTEFSNNRNLQKHLQLAHKTPDLRYPITFLIHSDLASVPEMGRL